MRLFAAKHILRGTASRRAAPLALLLCTVLVPAECFSGSSALQHGVIWYSAAPNDQVRQRSAERYVLGITGKGERSDLDKLIIKSLNPAFRWFVYNSCTDNYVVPHPLAPVEHDLLVSLATQRGWDPEEAYLHFFDDTQVALDGDTLFIPGWGGGSAAKGESARIPVYYADTSRRLVSFATRRAAQLHKEVMLHLAFDTPFDNSSLYPDGIFLDNAAAVLFNYGTILSGGHVREAAGRSRLDSPEFRSWHWNSNLGPFLSAFKDTLEVSPAWSPDGRRKFLMINVANVWDDSYVSKDVADILFLEYQYNPVRAVGSGAMDEAHRRDVLAAAAGISSFYGAVVWRTVPGRGEFSYAQALLGNLAWYLITRTENTLLFPMETSVPAVAGWDTLTWRGCFDVANERLGRVSGEPFTLAEGVDPLGNRYVVKARRYENGMAVLRNRGEWNQGIEPETAVRVSLPTPLLPVSPAGNIGAAVQSVSLRNGEGALFLDGGESTQYVLVTTSVGSGIVRLDPYRARYDPGSFVSLWALPELGWRFARWEGDLTGPGNPSALRMDADHRAHAVFEVNTAPLGIDDAYSFAPGVPLHVPSPGVLGNDSDPNGDPFTASLLTGPRHGVVALDAAGSFTYFPEAGFAGTDGFTYGIQDRYFGSAAANVTLVANGAPSPLAIAESQSGGSSSANTVSTNVPFGSSPAALFLAVVSCKPARTVAGVSGLGLPWTRVTAQCSGRAQTGLEIWMARGNAASGGVTATFETSPTNAVIAVSRITGADAVNPVGAIISGNTNGEQGTCTGGTDGSAYTFELASTGSGLLFGAVAMRNKSNSPSAGAMETLEVHQGSGGDEASVALVQRPTLAGQTPLAGTLSGTTDWAAAGIELRPAIASGGAAKGWAPAVGPWEPPALRLSPNPAHATTLISYDLPAGTVVKVTIYDASGRRVRQFAPALHPPGAHDLPWDGRNDLGLPVASGIYFVLADFGGSTATAKLVFQR